MSKAHRKPSIDRTIRGWADWLGMWALCDNPACRGAQGCRGQIKLCAPKYFHQLPEDVQAFFWCLMQAKEQGLSFDEALAGFSDDSPALDGMLRWHAAVENSARTGKRLRAASIRAQR